MANTNGYLLELTQKDKETARKILQEPVDLTSEISSLRTWVEEQKHFTAPTDDAFLTCVLRLTRFNQNDAAEFLEHYIQRRTTPPLNANFTNTTDIHEKVDWALKNGVCMALPSVGENRVRTIIARGNYDISKIHARDKMRALLLCLDIVFQDPVTQIHGFQLVFDHSKSPYRFFTQLSRNLAKDASELMVKSAPLQFKGVHHVNSPRLLNGIITIFMMFLSSHAKRRIHNHGSNMSRLHQHVEREVLPQELGGSPGTYADLAGRWYRHVTENVEVVSRFTDCSYKAETGR